MNRSLLAFCVFLVALSVTACRRNAASVEPRASGYVEATEVRVASKVAGRVVTVSAAEGARVAQGDVLATLATTDADLALDRARAERAAADAQVRLLRAGSRVEDIRQAEAQVAAATADQRASEADLASARADEARFEQLLQKRAGSVKQRDDATARRQVAEARVKAVTDRAAAATATLARQQAGARPEELDAARARVSAIDADIASLNDKRGEATVVSPTAGIVTSRLVEPGELVAAGVPVAVVVDSDRAWVNAYVEEPMVPALKVDQSVTVVTDGGQRIPGRIAFIAPRAEFTPRNVQTSAERAKLVYRVKVSVDNRQGVLKPGMPVDVMLTADGGQMMAAARSLGDAGNGSIAVLTDVHKAFGATVALDGVSLEVQRGEMFGVIGPDGAGKTTLLRLICGLLAPDRGTVRLFGDDPYRSHGVATAGIGYVSQRFSLYGDLSIDENIEFFARLHGVSDFGPRRERLLTLTGLVKFRDRLADRLSGGMKQKLALACTLVHEPPLLVLDEPTTGVDPVSRREFWKLLAEFLGQGLTILLATPYLDEAERCSRVVLLTDGRRLALDTPGHLQSAMEGAVFEIVVPEPRRALDTLRVALGADRVQLFGDRLHAHVTSDVGADRISGVIHQAGLVAVRVRQIVPSLEDVFIEYVQRPGVPIHTGKTAKEA